MGNFYVDFIKIITRFLLPASIIVGIILVSQGVPQNLNSNMIVSTIEGKTNKLHLDQWRHWNQLNIWGQTEEVFWSELFNTF